jgi:hypothetical protein
MLQTDTAASVRDAFPVLGTPAGLAAEATVCAQLLQTVARGDKVPVMMARRIRWMVSRR